MTQPGQQWIQVGIKTIDEQHKGLFELMGRVRVLSADDSKLGEMIKQLEDYIVHHFSEEEKYMLNHKYPDYQNHRSAHVQFMKEFSEIKVDFHMKDQDVKVNEKLNYMLNEWWINHVANIDKKLGEFLVSNGVQ